MAGEPRLDQILLLDGNLALKNIYGGPMDMDSLLQFSAGCLELHFHISLR